jgi:general secretion pathway protein B
VSLILDALRKADAERERGSVPGLHSQPVVPLSAETPKKPVSRPHWLFIAIGVAVGLALAATWVLVGREAASPVVAVTPPQQPIPPAPLLPAPAGGAPMIGMAPPPSATARPDGQPAAQPAPWPAPEERKTPRGDATVNPPGAPAGTAASADTTVHSREQLPPHIRAALPPFTIGGSIYSPNPAGRSLIVNGQLYRQGERLTQDLALEEIRLKAAVFSFRGYRFEVLF